MSADLISVADTASRASRENPRVCAYAHGASVKMEVVKRCPSSAVPVGT